MNWGNKLLVAFLIFGGLMAYLVYRSLNTNFELVEKDYYKSELRYQQVIDGSKRLSDLNLSLLLKQTEKEVVLELPAALRNKESVGDVWFYCAYDARKDKRVPLKTNAEGIQLFAKESFSPGNYIVKINWLMDNQYYYTEEKLSIQ
jgi:hypothetical protein